MADASVGMHASEPSTVNVCKVMADAEHSIAPYQVYVQHQANHTVTVIASERLTADAIDQTHLQSIDLALPKSRLPWS